MDKIDKAMRRIKRADFLPNAMKAEADIDTALPIGYGQTNSQPSTVRMMLRWLKILPGQNILDVGSGSGWTTALLSALTGSKGYVYAVERIPELLAFGRQNCEQYDLTNATFHKAGDQFGLPDFAPYDRILVSASTEELPKELLEQLKPGGKMVIPIKHDILEITKTAGGKFDVRSHPGFMFVPLL